MNDRASTRRSKAAGSPSDDSMPTAGLRAVSPEASQRDVTSVRLRDPAYVQGGIRELVLLVVVLAGASRFLEGPLVWVVLAITAVAVGLGSLQLMGDSHPTGETIGIPIEALVLPTVAAIAGIGVIRLAPVGVALVPVLVLLGFSVQQAVKIELKILLAPHGASASDRSSVLVQALVLAFAAFAGIAALVPGGLPELQGLGPSGNGVPAGSAPALSDASLATLVAGDALVAGLLGYRAAALRMATVRDVALSAATYAAVIAIAAGGVRAMEIPRLLGPGLLTLVLYLWDTIHGAPPARRRDARRLWEALLLAALGALVVAWILASRS